MTLEMELKKQFNDGREIGFADGHAKGRAETEAEVTNILRALQNGESVSSIANRLNISIQKVQEYYDLTAKK